MTYFLIILAAIFVAIVGFILGAAVIDKMYHKLILSDDNLIKAQDDLIQKLNNQVGTLRTALTIKDQLIAAQKELIDSNPQLVNMIKEASKDIN